jgi:hypothetical protein
MILPLVKICFILPYHVLYCIFYNMLYCSLSKDVWKPKLRVTDFRKVKKVNHHHHHITTSPCIYIYMFLTAITIVIVIVSMPFLIIIIHYHYHYHGCCCFTFAYIPTPWVPFDGGVIPFASQGGALARLRIARRYESGGC